MIVVNGGVHPANDISLHGSPPFVWTFLLTDAEKSFGLLNEPTTLGLKPDHVDYLIEAGADLPMNSPEFCCLTRRSVEEEGIGIDANAICSGWR